MAEHGAQQGELVMVEENPPPVDPIDLSPVAEMISRIGDQPPQVIPLLQAVQEHYRYLPAEAMEYIVAHTAISPTLLTSVSTFYRQFRHRPAGKHTIKVCIGTPCHVKGAPAVIKGYKDALGIPEDDDTDTQREFTIEGVACLGCCTLAPVVLMDGLTYAYVHQSDCGRLVEDFRRLAAEGKLTKPPIGDGHAIEGEQEIPEIRIGLGSCCLVKGADTIFNAVTAAVREAARPVQVRHVGCQGMCFMTPLLEVAIPGQDPILYTRIKPERAADIVHRHFPPPNPLRRVRRWLSGVLDRAVTGDVTDHMAINQRHFAHPEVDVFLAPQMRIVTDASGILDPVDIDDYLRSGGFEALRTALHESIPEQVIEEISASGLRGRGGAGFPTGRKWQLGRAQPGPKKYVVCNGDEGDPGAFMDRKLLESFPYRVIEGMILQAYAVGADEGYFYVRAEYPLALKRLRIALEVCRERGILGLGILGSSFNLELHVKEGAGAFVCGEESALIESIEGRRGFPRLRPPYPVESGLWGKPTVVNNIETLATISWIMRHGAKEFTRYGTEDSKGTKVFSLVGKIRRGALVEVPMGITIREVVEKIGGGIADGKRLKAVQIGGPSGGCIPASYADVKVDYKALTELGAMMGSGGFVVMDEDDCMVDIARYFLNFTQEEACGQCSVGRIGTRRMLDILDRLCAGEAKRQDIAELEHLCTLVQDASLCQLCKTAPNPVLTTLRYFRDEYEAHVAGRCPAGKCQALIHYYINERCNGCTKCAQVCPVDAIAIDPYRRHVVDDETCTRCNACRLICPLDAVEVR